MARKQEAGGAIEKGPKAKKGRSKKSVETQAAVSALAELEVEGNESGQEDYKSKYENIIAEEDKVFMERIKKTREGFE